MTYRIFAVLAFVPAILEGQPFIARVGVYQFTDITASEFYVAAPCALAGYEVWGKSRLGLDLTSGLAFNSVRYNSHRHQLFIVPIFIDLKYSLPNPGARVIPVISGGIGLMGKADVNADLEKNAYSLAFGYHASGGLEIPLNEKLALCLEAGYHLMLPPVLEEINISGILLTIGIKGGHRNRKALLKESP